MTLPACCKKGLLYEVAFCVKHLFIDELTDSLEHLGNERLSQ